MKQMHELSGLENPLNASSRPADELKLSVELEMATEQKLEAAPLREPTAAALEPTPLAMTSPTARVSRAATPSLAGDGSIPQTSAILETKPIVDVIDKADVIQAEAISTEAKLSYEPGPAVIVTDATIGLPPTPEVEFLDDPDDAVIDAELIPLEDASGVIEVLEPLVIDEGNA